MILEVLRHFLEAKIKNRVLLKKGYYADIVIFDPDTIGSGNRGERRYDLPGGGKRMVMPSQGVLYTLVNGHVVYADGNIVGSGSGQILRS